MHSVAAPKPGSIHLAQAICEHVLLVLAQRGMTETSKDGLHAANNVGRRFRLEHAEVFLDHRHKRAGELLHHRTELFQYGVRLRDIGPVFDDEPDDGWEIEEVHIMLSVGS